MVETIAAVAVLVITIAGLCVLKSFGVDIDWNKVNANWSTVSPANRVLNLDGRYMSYNLREGETAGYRDRTIVVGKCRKAKQRAVELQRNIDLMSLLYDETDCFRYSNCTWTIKYNGRHYDWNLKNVVYDGDMKNDWHSKRDFEFIAGKLAKLENGTFSAWDRQEIKSKRDDLRREYNRIDGNRKRKGNKNRGRRYY